MDASKFKEVLERARAKAAATTISPTVVNNINNNAANIVAEMTVRDTASVDLSMMGIDDESIKTDAGAEAAVEAVSETLQTGHESQPTPEKKSYGVTRDIILNDKQFQFNELVQSGVDCVLIGAAGTGKTTSMRKVTTDLIASGRIKTVNVGTKWLQAGKPGAAILSYTRKAVNNIKQAVAPELKQHTLTIHKLLEFAPIFYEIVDDENGDIKKTMRFEPSRNATNPLPPDLTFIAFEESSMISVELYKMLNEALPHEHQEVFLGDIQQLPPIFGMAILGFKMLELPVVELTEVYRQALESPIITLAWRILEGNSYVFKSTIETREEIHPATGNRIKRNYVPSLVALSQSTPAGTVKFQPWQKRLSSDYALITSVKQFQAWADDGYYNPQDDIILCPFNKAFGTIELNKGIAQHLGVKRGAIVNEVIAGFNKHYLAVGDRVLYDKEDAYITSISNNGQYLGKRPIPASLHLDRHGHYRESLSQEEVTQQLEKDSEMDLAAIESFMNAASGDNEDRVQAASHVITIKLAYGEGEEIVLDAASEINNLLGGYAITVHKAQGSEYDKVFFLMHHSYAVMNSRELLYTAVTRAKKFLHIICETNTFESGVKSQRIEGTTIAQKARTFQGKAESKTKDGSFDIEWTKKHVLSILPRFTGSDYKGQIRKEEVAAITETAAPTKLVKLESLVPPAVKLMAENALTKWWTKAVAIWGDKLEQQPTLNYKLQRVKIIGQAEYASNNIGLNPVWCIAALDNTEVNDLMFQVTIPHEIAHFVNHRFSNGQGYDSGWEMAMKLLGLPADKTYKGDDLPPWAEKYAEIISSTKEKLAKEDADFSEYE